jgi:hypothetical protein
MSRTVALSGRGHPANQDGARTGGNDIGRAYTQSLVTHSGRWQAPNQYRRAARRQNGAAHVGNGAVHGWAGMEIADSRCWWHGFGFKWFV